jgi:hypothetical protein
MDDGTSGDAHAPLVVASSPNEIQATWWDNWPGPAAGKIFTRRSIVGWDARNDSGRRVAPGTYHASLFVDRARRSGKTMTVVR